MLKHKIKRVIVTGGAGFLGSHLCEKLLELNYYVICIDNFFTGTMENIKKLLKHPNFELFEHDICLPFDFDDIDEIYNLACPASPIHYQSDPIHTMETCFLGSLNCLKLAKKNNAKIFQASTSEIYGDPHVHPQHESYWGNVNPKGVRSCYDEGKRCSETLFFDFNRIYNIPIKVGRIFNTYGPRMHPNDGRVVSNFIVQALLGEDLTIYGSGKQTRSFCFVSDLIDSFIKFMHTDDSILGPINLGNPVEFEINDLAQKVIEITDSSSSIVFKPLPLDDPKQRKPDISKAKKMLNWEPQIPLSEGLYETMRYFKKKLSDVDNLKVNA